MLWHFSASKHDNHVVGTSRSGSHNEKWQTSSSSRSSSRSPAGHRLRRSSPMNAIWVPGDTSRTSLSHLVGSSKFSTSRAYDDSRVNPERARNLSDSMAGHMFGPTLPPSILPEEAEINRRRSSTSDTSDAGKEEVRSRQRETSRDEIHSARKKTGRNDERRSVARSSSSRRRKASTSRKSSSASCSHSYSSTTSMSTSPGSRSAEKLPPTKGRSSFSVSRSRPRKPHTRRSRSSSTSSSGRKAVRKRVKRSSSSTSSDSTDRPVPYTKASVNIRSKKDQFEEHRDHRRHRQGSRRGDYAEYNRARDRAAKDRTVAMLPRKNHSFSGRQKSRSNSRDRLKKRTSIQTHCSDHKEEHVDQRSRSNSDRKEPAQIGKSDGVGGIPIANCSSDSDERTDTPRNKSGVAEKASVLKRKVTDSKKVAPGRQTVTATAATDRDKNTDAGKAKTDDKPKETLEDMELFLKQLKANKQQQMLNK